ncbi:MAG: hypothetical protein K2H45_11940 [Acetatifactor sp.]|nr:hypothetical protein [Acetatifactor sp.]
MSQAIAVARSAVYDTNVKFLLSDKQILARILKYTIRECRDMDPGPANLGRVREAPPVNL